MPSSASKKMGHVSPAVVTGKPVSLGGSGGGREGTGVGVAFRVGKSRAVMKVPVGGFLVAIQGFGNVGGETAIALSLMGARIIAVSDYTGGIYNPAGIDIKKALAYIR